VSARDELERRFDALLAVHGPALGRLAASYTRGLAEREDLLQDIALAIWRALPRFRGESSERTFVFRIAHNRAITQVGRRRPETVDLREDELIVADTRPDPERSFSAGQQGERLLDAIRRLPLPYAQVITLTLEGLGYAEIAEVLGISETNVGARLTRARQTLRALLGASDGR
jgi:RNA polymerase sigma-70 factor, ECF subfamily